MQNQNNSLSSYEEFAPDVVNTIRNSRLLSAIGAVLYSGDVRNQQAFILTLLESNLILLNQEAPVPPKDQIIQFDEEGYCYYGIDTKIALVQLNSEKNELILPVYTESKFVHSINGLSSFHGLAMPAVSALELCMIAGSDVFSINPGTKYQLDIGRDSVLELVSKLRLTGLLPETDSLIVD